MTICRETKKQIKLTVVKNKKKSLELLIGIDLTMKIFRFLGEKIAVHPKQHIFNLKTIVRLQSYTGLGGKKVTYDNV